MSVPNAGDVFVLGGGGIHCRYRVDGDGNARAALPGSTLGVLATLRAAQTGGAATWAVRLRNRYGFDVLAGLGEGLAADTDTTRPLYAALSGTLWRPLAFVGPLWLDISGATAGVGGTVQIEVAPVAQRAEHRGVAW